MPPTKILLPHLPLNTHPIYIQPNHSVPAQNISHIHSELLASNTAYNYTFLDARTILSKTHLLAACLRALIDEGEGRMRSREVHGEIVGCLSANRDLGEGFRRFGIGGGGGRGGGSGSRVVTGSIVVIKVGDGREWEEEDVRKGLVGKVGGVEVPWDEVEEWLVEVCDLDLVRKNYKLGKAQANAHGGKKGVVNGVKEGDEEENEMMRKKKEMEELERVILGMMALRGAN